MDGQLLSVAHDAKGFMPVDEGLALYDAADIRHIETFEELTPSSAHHRHWSAL